MPVNSTHPEYDSNLPLWQKVRIAIEGEEAVKAAGSIFLPILSGQLEGEYSAYKSRAMFYGASSRTVQGLTGAIFRKPIEYKFPDSKYANLDTIGRFNESLEDISKKIVERAVGIGRVGILVDAPAVENGQPFVALYEAENIINWLEIDGQDGSIAVEIVLLEHKYERDDDDPFISKKKIHYRVLRLGFPGSDSGVSDDELEQGAVYYQDLYEENVEEKNGKETTSYVLKSRTIPRKRGGQVWRRIPFTTVNSSTIGLRPQKSPILDLVNVNLSHYRNSADLEHGRHFTALPTAWVAGFDPQTILTIGASRAWVSQDTSARAGFLEFSGEGLGHLQAGMASKEKLMAILGARMLEELPVGTEAAETVRLRQSGEASALSSIALICSTAIKQVLIDYAEWLGLPQSGVDSISVSLNRDFQTAGLAPNVLQNLILAVQGGLVSWNTFFYNLKRGELIADHVDEDTELSLIKEGSAMFIVKDKDPKTTDKKVKTQERLTT